MSGANASPTRSASATARSLKKGRSHQEMSGANLSPRRSASAIARSLKTRSASAIARSFKKGRNHQVWNLRFRQIAAVARLERKDNLRHGGLWEFTLWALGLPSSF